MPSEGNKFGKLCYGDEEMLLMAYVTKEKLRFLDSGCNNLMCGNRESFVHLDERLRTMVTSPVQKSKTIAVNFNF